MEAKSEKSDKPGTTCAKSDKLGTACAKSDKLGTACAKGDKLGTACAKGDKLGTACAKGDKLGTACAKGDRTPLIVAGIFLGLGLSGFFDGIVLHQILQWHHMLSSVRPLTTVSNIDINTVWDGLFHAFDWIMTVIGVILLWRAGGRDDVPWSFNLYFGSIFVHHVKPGLHQLAWDLGFLASGALLVALGSVMIKRTES
jgi:uncharacterized membrane protein